MQVGVRGCDSGSECPMVKSIGYLQIRNIPQSIKHNDAPPLAANPVQYLPPSLCTPYSTPLPANLGNPARQHKPSILLLPLSPLRTHLILLTLSNPRKPAARHTITASIPPRAQSPSSELPPIHPTNLLSPNSCLAHSRQQLRHKGTRLRALLSLSVHAPALNLAPPSLPVVRPKLQCAHNRVASPIPIGVDRPQQRQTE